MPWVLRTYDDKTGELLVTHELDSWPEHCPDNLAGEHFFMQFEGKSQWLSYVKPEGR